MSWRVIEFPQKAKMAAICVSNKFFDSKLQQATR